MPLRKNFKVINSRKNSRLGRENPPDAGFKNYQSTLPEVYSGHPNRVERYSQYETMDHDSEINAALDILSEFCTQTTVENKMPFYFFYKKEPSDTEVTILNEALSNWLSLNEFHRRIFKIFRNSLKYGDQIFFRDPETFKWHWVDNSNVVKVIVNESKGKEPEQYVIKNLNINFQNLTATQPEHSDIGSGTVIGANTNSKVRGNPNNLNTPGSTGTRFNNTKNETAVDAAHIIHISLTEGLDPNWPFGVSVLESVFKVFKQKELLEDAIIIYRVQRAPERRVFYIDVGNMPQHMAMGYINNIKNEIHQRRIPTQSGGADNMMDATYNPISTNEDYYFAQTAEGRGSKVETLPGGQNLGDIDDLKYFTNKLFRGLRIPSSYLPTGSEDGSAVLSDGRLGTALIQENRFNQYCKRLQANISDSFDTEFKTYLNYKGYNIDSNLFDLRFNEPQNFAAYRQADIDAQRVQLFQTIASFPFISKQFNMKRFLGLTEDELAENSGLWYKEQGKEPEQEAMVDLRSVGVTPGNLKSELDDAEGAQPPRPRPGGGGRGRPGGPKPGGLGPGGLGPPGGGGPPGGPGGPGPGSPAGPGPGGKSPGSSIGGVGPGEVKI